MKKNKQISILVLMVLASACHKENSPSYRELKISSSSLSNATIYQIQSDPAFKQLVTDVGNVSNWMNYTKKPLSQSFADSLSNTTNDAAGRSLLSQYFLYSTNLYNTIKSDSILARTLNAKYGSSNVNSAWSDYFGQSSSTASQSNTVTPLYSDDCQKTRDAALKACNNTEYFIMGTCILGGFINVFAGLACEVMTHIAAHECRDDAIKDYDNCLGIK